MKGSNTPRQGPRSQALDLVIGQRVRLARVLAGKSQGALGKECGITFQQIQKYENGLNRITASRLYLIAKALNQPLNYFFQDNDKEAPPDAQVVPRERQLIEFVKVAKSMSPDVIDILTKLLRSLGRAPPT